MPVIAVNVIKVLFALALYGFLFYVARAMRGHVAGPPVDPNPTPAPASRRRTRAEDSPPPAPRRATLEIAGPAGGDPKVVRLTGRLVLGRGASADVVIDDEYSSERHAAFELVGDVVWVEDLGSTNGTRIGETRLTERTVVRSGTEVMVGRTRVVVR